MSWTRLRYEECVAVLGEREDADTELEVLRPV